MITKLNEKKTKRYFSKLSVTYQTNGIFRLNRSLYSEDGRKVTKGFLTDFASIPQLAKGLVRSNDIPISAVFHDYALTQLAKEQVEDRKKRLKLWLKINRQMLKDMSHQGRHVSRFRKWLILKGINSNARIKCIMLNKHPELPIINAWSQV